MRWLRRGYSVVVDATFGQVAEREAIRRVAARSGARLCVLVCQADEATIRRRLAARARTDFLSTSDARLDIWPALRAAYSAPEEVTDAVVLDATARPDAGARAGDRGGGRSVLNGHRDHSDDAGRDDASSHSRHPDRHGVAAERA